MNDVQKVVFNLFKNFVTVCEKLNLKYYLVNGSALGAVKYCGFIPWDDDLDVAMPRKDYEIFLEKAQDYFPENIFLQNYRTDKKFPQIYSKLRNSETAFIESGVSRLEMNHGIYMDIFPLDSASESFISSKYNSLKIKFLFWLAFCALQDNRSVKIKIRNLILRFFGFHKITDKSLKTLDSLISNDSLDTFYLCNYADRQHKGNIPREWYGNGTEVVFEGITARIPEKFDEYFTYKYGDWRKDLPLSEQKSHHISIICDSEKSYRNYLNK